MAKRPTPDDIKYYYAYKSDGKPTTIIDELRSTNTHFKGPCGCPFKAIRKTKNRFPFFAHITECESAAFEPSRILHDLVQELFSEIESIQLCPIKWGKGPEDIIRQAKSIQIYEISKEVTIYCGENKRRVDIVAQTEDGKLGIEIAVTNKKKQSERKDFAEYGIDVIEIEFPQFIALSRDEIKEYIVHKAHRRWVNHHLYNRFWKEREKIYGESKYTMLGANTNITSEVRKFELKYGKTTASEEAFWRRHTEACKFLQSRKIEEHLLNFLEANGSPLKAGNRPFELKFTRKQISIVYFIILGLFLKQLYQREVYRSHLYNSNDGIFSAIVYDAIESKGRLLMFEELYIDINILISFLHATERYTGIKMPADPGERYAMCKNLLEIIMDTQLVQRVNNTSLFCVQGTTKLKDLLYYKIENEYVFEHVALCFLHELATIIE